jgi:dTMP kinase
LEASARPGFFITFEGIDGAGKSTHIPRLAQLLQAQGHSVLCTREPGGTQLAERLRELLLHQAMDTVSEVLLMFAARRDHVCQVIEPALAQGRVVLCDRFSDATFAYQGAGRGFSETILQTLEQLVHPECHPNLTLWFDVPAQVAAQRRAQAREADRFEQLGTDFFERVRQGYIHRAYQNEQRFVRIDATQSVDAVAQLLWEQLQTRISSPTRSSSAGSEAA